MYGHREYWGSYYPGAFIPLDCTSMRQDWHKQEKRNRLQEELENADVRIRFTKRVLLAVREKFWELNRKETLTRAEKVELWRLDDARRAYAKRLDYYTSTMDYSPVIYFEDDDDE